MKKFLVLALISVLVLSVFVACGSGDDNSGSGNSANMKDDITTMMDDISSNVDEFADDLTEGKNIGEEEDKNGEGILDDIMPDDNATTDTTDEAGSDASGESTSGAGAGTGTAE